MSEIPDAIEHARSRGTITGERSHAAAGHDHPPRMSGQRPGATPGTGASRGSTA
jgi:hypothetical protein